MVKNYVELNVQDMFGNKYYKKITNTKINFVSLRQNFGNWYVMHYYTDSACGKPIWLKESDIDKLLKLKAGLIELKEDGTYIITKTYNPIIYLQRGFINSIGMDGKLSLKNNPVINLIIKRLPRKRGSMYE